MDSHKFPSPIHNSTKIHPENSEKEIKITDMKVFGLTSTRKYVVTSSFPKLSDVKNIKDLDDALEEGLINLNRIDVFKKCDIFLDYDDDLDEVTINILVNETNKKFKKFGASVERDMKTLKTKMKFDMVFQNIVGLADNFTLGCNVGTNLNDIGFESKYYVPFQRKFDLEFTANLFDKIPFLKKKNSNEWILQQKRNSIGVNLLKNRHQIAYEFAHRNVEELISDNLTSTFLLPASIEIGKSIKSSISHVYTLNKRTSSKSGYFFKMTNSLAGLGGNVNHFQSNIITQKFIDIFKYFTLEFKVESGITVPLDKDKKVSAVDRFYPQVRGKGTGLDMEKKDGKGGNFSFSTLIRLLCPIRFHEIFQFLGLHLHTFLNTSSVENFFSNENSISFTDKKQFFKDFINGMYATIGIGLVFTLGMFNIELNYIKPVHSNNEEMNKFEANFYVQPQ
eukprot:gene8368-193_t